MTSLQPLAFDDEGGGAAVVLVHGHPFDRSMWNAQVDALGQRFRVIAPDLRGYGESPATPGTVTMRELAADIELLLDELGVEAYAAVGLSMGGLVAMELALARPERTWALGLVATTAQPLSEAERRERLALADMLEAHGMDLAADAMGHRLLGPAAPADLAAAVDRMMRRNNPRGAAAALRGRAQRPDYRPLLARLDLPTFICVGTADTYSTADVTRELVDCFESSLELILPEIGHLPNLESPDVFNHELLTFLESASGRRDSAAT